MLTDRKGFVNVDKATANETVVIAAPGVGKHIEIDHFNLLADGGANTVTLEFGATKIAEYNLASGQAIAFDAPANNALSSGINEAFNLTLSAATSVTGFVLYRIVGD
jgi:hypothetical protein